MKVRDLQKLLSKLDPDLEVVCYIEEEKLVNNKTACICLEITAVNEITAKRYRGKDGTGCLEFGEVPDSSPIAILELTRDF